MMDWSDIELDADDAWTRFVSAWRVIGCEVFSRAFCAECGNICGGGDVGCQLMPPMAETDDEETT